MNKWFYILCLLFILCLPLRASSVSYDALVKQAAQWSSEKVVQTADAYHQKGNKECALVLYMVAAGRTQGLASEQDFRLAASAHIGAGDVYYESGNYANALNFYLKGLKLTEQTEKKPLRAVFYKNMGNVYCMFQDYEKGLSLYKQALGVAREQNDLGTAYKILQNLTGVSINLGNVAEARRYYEESQSTPHEVTRVSRFMDEFTLALILRDEGQREESLRRFKRLANEARQPEIGARYECSCYEEIYTAYHQLHQTDSTITYLTRCKDLAEASGLLHEYSETLHQLSTIYENRGDKGRALQFRSRYWQVRDSVFNRRKFDAAKNQQFLYEMEKISLEIARMTEEQEKRARVISRQQWIIGCTVAAVLIVLLVLYYVYRQNRRLSESYRSLYSLHRRLSESHRRAQAEDRRLSEENARLSAQLESLSQARPEVPQGELSAKSAPSATAPAAEHPAAEHPAEGETAKYSSSSLSDTQRRSLARSIAEVMDEQEAFCSPDFSLDALAALVNSNSKYVSQVINEVYGKNFSNYVNEHRVELACLRLADTDRFAHFSIKGIGESVGFKSHSTFINVFKKSTGITPSLYQKLTREEAEKLQKQD